MTTNIQPMKSGIYLQRNDSGTSMGKDLIYKSIKEKSIKKMQDGIRTILRNGESYGNLSKM